MKNSESKSRKLHFNVIDVLIIVLVVACIVAAVLRFTVLDNLFKNNEQKEYTLTFKVDSLTSAQLEAILLSADETDTGDNWVYLSDGETKLGELIRLGEQNTETLYFVNEKGETVAAKYSDSDIENDEDVTWTITGTITCYGVYNNTNGFLLNGKQYIAANSELDVRTKYCDFVLSVVSIEEADKR